jgi:hypothetical protein
MILSFIEVFEYYDLNLFSIFPQLPYCSSKSGHELDTFLCRTTVDYFQYTWFFGILQTRNSKKENCVGWQLKEYDIFNCTAMLGLSVIARPAMRTLLHSCS